MRVIALEEEQSSKYRVIAWYRSVEPERAGATTKIGLKDSAGSAAIKRRSTAASARSAGCFAASLIRLRITLCITGGSCCDYPAEKRQITKTFSRRPKRRR